MAFATVSGPKRGTAEAAHGAAIGTLIFSFFGTIWIVASFLLSHPRNLLWLAPAVTIVPLLAIPARDIMRRTKAAATVLSTPQSKRRERQFRIVNIAQWVAIVLVIVAANVLQRPNIIVPGVILVVGFHFLPLARTFGYWPHYVTGIAMVVWGLVYPHLFGLGTQDPSGPFGAGVLILASGVNSLLTAKRIAKSLELRNKQ